MSTIALTASRPAYGRLVVGCVCAGIAALVLGAWASSAGMLRPRRPVPQDVHHVMFALEMLRETDRPLLHQMVRPPVAGEQAEGLARRNEPAKMIGAVQIDSAFIAAYATFLVLLGLLTRRTRFSPLAFLIIGGGVAAAVFDVKENVALLDLLRELPGPLPRAASLTKWGLLFATVAIIAPTLIERGAPSLRRWIGYAGALVSVVTAIEGLYGIARQNDQAIESAGGRLSIAFLLALLFVSTRQTLRDGLLAALDRLAQFRIFRWLTAWPRRDTHENVGSPL